MHGGIYNPAATQAPIAGKAFIDLQEIANRTKAVNDPNPNNKPLGGASNKSNFQIYPHQLVVGHKQGSGGNYAGDNCEYGLTTAAGLEIKHSAEQTMRDMYLLGVATSEVPYDGDTMFSSDPIGDSFSFLRSGTTTIRYYDNKDAFPGDLLEWTIPIPAYKLPAGEKPMGSTFDTGYNPIHSNNIRGEIHHSNPVYYARKFDPRDASLQLMAVSNMISKGEINSITPNDVLGNGDTNEYTSLQEEAAGLMHGIMAIAEITRLIDNDAKIDKNNKNIAIFDAVFHKYRQSKTSPKTEVDTSLTGDAKRSNEELVKLQNERIPNALKLLTSAILGGAYARSERVFCKLLNAVKPGDDADIMMQHVKLGF
jgi:hypothetical protein